MPRRKKTEEKTLGEKALRELVSKAYHGGYKSALRRCAFTIGMEKLGNTHGFMPFFRAMCVGLDVNAIHRRIELILKSNSWHEVFSAEDAAATDSRVRRRRTAQTRNG